MASKGISYEDLVSNLEILVTQVQKEEYIEDRLARILKKYQEFIKDGVYYKEESGSLQYYTPYDAKSHPNGIENIVSNSIDYATKILKSYLNGDLKTCISLGNQWWYKQVDTGKKVLPATSIDTTDVFYRIRVQKEEYKGFKRKDLFHVPFQKRGQISTNRYSLLGYPCLYLGRSIYTCWEEAHRPKLDTFFVSAFRPKQKIYLLDFRLHRDIFENNWAFRKYLCVLPMIIACSLRVEASDDKFRAEYILPQIILHNIITTAKKIINWEGIMFTSTQVDNTFNINKFDSSITDNLAIPIQVNGAKGWCPKLCGKFTMTVPTNYEYEVIKTPVFVSNKVQKGDVLDKGEETYIPEDTEDGLNPFELMENRLKKRAFKGINHETGEDI